MKHYQDVIINVIIDIIETISLAVFFSLILVHIGWFNQPSPCKHQESYSCIRLNCHTEHSVWDADDKGREVCIPYEALCSRCVERNTGQEPSP